MEPIHKELEAQTVEILDDVFMDDGIKEAVRILRAHHITTIESCEGGHAHPFSHPRVRFSGDRHEGFRAFTIAMQHGLDVVSLSRRWSAIDGELTGPDWIMKFRPVKELIAEGSSAT
jgi:hypothetical protein